MRRASPHEERASVPSVCGFLKGRSEELLPPTRFVASWNKNLPRGMGDEGSGDAGRSGSKRRSALTSAFEELALQSDAHGRSREGDDDGGEDQDSAPWHPGTLNHLPLAPTL